MGTQSLSHWTTRGVPQMVNFSQHFTVDMSGEFRIISLESLCLSSFLVSSSNRLLSMCLGTGHCISSVQSFSRVLTLCNPSDCSMPGFPVHHQLLQLAQTHVHPVTDAIQGFLSLSSPFPSAFNPSQHQGLFQ